MLVSLVVFQVKQGIEMCASGVVQKAMAQFNIPIVGKVDRGLFVYPLVQWLPNWKVDRLCLLEHDKHRLHRAQVEGVATILIKGQSIALACLQVPNLGLSFVGQGLVEGDFGLMCVVAVAVTKQNHLAAIIGM